MFLCPSTVFSADKPAEVASNQTLEQTLKSKGLTKVGNCFLLESDLNLPEWLRDARGSEYRLAAKIKDRVKAESAFDRAKETVIKWYLYDLELNTKLIAAGKAHSSAQPDIMAEIADIERRLVESTIELPRMEKELEQFGDPSADYIEVLEKLSSTAEGLATHYAELSKDDEVTGAIKRLNSTAGKLKLGPSPQFTLELRNIRKMCESIASCTIPLNSSLGVPQAEVVVNGKFKIPMIVDSGAAMVTLTPEAAKLLGLNPGANDKVVHLVSADGKVTDAHVMTLKTLTLGRFTVRDVQCAVQPSNIKGADCLLGGTFLKHFVYRMNLASNELRLSQVGGKLDAQPPAAGPIKVVPRDGKAPPSVK